MGQAIHDLPNGDRDLLAGGANTTGKIADEFQMSNQINLELPDVDGDEVMNSAGKDQKDNALFEKGPEVSNDALGGAALLQEHIDHKLLSLEELTCIKGENADGHPGGLANEIEERNGKEYEEFLAEVQRQLVKDLVVGEDCLKNDLQKKFIYSKHQNALLQEEVKKLNIY